MKDIAFLEYNFMFSPADTSFSSIYQFENQLADFFKSRGLEAQVMKTVDGQMGKRIIFVSKIQSPVEIPGKEKLPQGRPPSVGRMMRNITPVAPMRAAEKKFRNRMK